MNLKNLLKGRERSKQLKQNEGTTNSKLNNEVLKDLTYQIKELGKCKSERREIRKATRKLEGAVCNAIYNTLKDELQSVPKFEISYFGIPISIIVEKDEVYFQLHGQAFRDDRLSYLEALIKYAPIICRRLERDIRHCKGESARDKKVYQALLDALTPLLVEAKLSHE